MALITSDIRRYDVPLTEADLHPVFGDGGSCHGLQLQSLLRIPTAAVR